MAIELPAPGHYLLTRADTRIDFTGTHLLGRPVRGSVELTSGEVDVPDDPSAATVTVVIDAASLDTGNKLRDVELRSPLFLSVTKHPTIEFTAAGPHRQQGGSWQVSGAVTAHGIPAHATLEITDLALTDDGFTARATARIDRYAHGVKGARGVAGRHIDVVITLTARR